jgi:hypothetical protein
MSKIKFFEASKSTRPLYIYDKELEEEIIRLKTKQKVKE